MLSVSEGHRAALQPAHDALGCWGRANRYDPLQLRAGQYEAHRVLVPPPDVFHQTETRLSLAEIFRTKTDTFENA